MLFPACAGVIPCGYERVRYDRAFPRMRGGDPIRALLYAFRNSFSPHARG